MISFEPRPMMLEEIDAVATLWHDTWRHTHDPIAPRALCDFRDLSYFRRRLEKEFAAVRVLGILGNPLGLCIVDDSTLDMLFVARGERGKGYGEQLLNDAENSMRGNGAKEAHLYVALRNHGAIRFYLRQGWKDAGAVEKTFEVHGGTMKNQVGLMTKPL